MKILRPFLIVLLLAGFLTGCETTPEYYNNESFRLAALDLVNDYLKIELEEREGTYQVIEKFGEGAVTLDLLTEYRVKGTGYDTAGRPAVFAWIKQGSERQGYVGYDYLISLKYNQALRDAGDKYMGFRIIEVRKLGP